MTAAYNDGEGFFEYNVQTRMFTMYQDYFWVTVTYGDQVIARDSFKSHKKAAKWAKKQIEEHQFAVRLIGDIL